MKSPNQVDIGARKILAIIGPTASGKSDLALSLAKETGAAIVSCDSLLVYKELNIGTAKPSSKEMETVPHFGINLVSINAPYNAGDYVRYARHVLDELVTKKNHVIITGGTGFYLKALLCGTWDAPPTQPGIREKLNNLDNSVLSQQLSSLDPEYATKVNPNDRYRLIRALEIIETTREKISDRILMKKNVNPLHYPVEIVGIRRKKDEIEKRILARTTSMFAQGLVQETKELLSHFPEIPKAMHCVGYSEVVDFLKDKLTIQECKERVSISTRQLAKKQMTFFKTFPLPINWFSLPEQDEAIREKALGVLLDNA